jgi:hypothetical protein
MQMENETLNQILTLINKIKVRQEETTKEITILNDRLNKLSLIVMLNDAFNPEPDEHI